MIAIAPTLDIYLPYVCKVSIYRLVWGYCFIRTKRQCEKPKKQDKTNIASTPFLFIIHHRKQVSVNILIMTKMQYNGEDPKLSEFFVILIVLVVIGIAAWLFS